MEFISGDKLIKISIESGSVVFEFESDNFHWGAAEISKEHFDLLKEIVSDPIVNALFENNDKEEGV